jgi:hypothetical protein
MMLVSGSELGLLASHTIVRVSDFLQHWGLYGSAMTFGRVGVLNVFTVFGIFNLHGFIGM